MIQDVQHVFMVGAKGLGTYGGYETFINKLTEYHQNNDKIKYHIVCKANGEGCMDENTLDGVEHISANEFVYHNAFCQKIHVPEIGSAQAIYFDIAALNACCEYIKEKRIEHPIVYIMACRIGPFIKHYYKKIHKLNGRIFLNPDGHEWMRAKWNSLIRKYWKLSERQMVKYCDLVVCDAVAIERYIQKSYDHKGVRGGSPRTIFIPYGAETGNSQLKNDNPELVEWYKDKELAIKGYYLVVGRFVPENNYETMIREFMKSNTERDLVIITNINQRFFDILESRLHFRTDKRIKFVGTVYNQKLLKKIRENAYGYIHGHEVGGTNPSLLEALGSTNVNLLLDVPFNREVGLDSAFYWGKTSSCLSKLIDQVDQLSEDEVRAYGEKAKARIRETYSWDIIASMYQNLFLTE